MAINTPILGAKVLISLFPKRAPANPPLFGIACAACESFVRFSVIGAKAAITAEVLIASSIDIRLNASIRPFNCCPNNSPELTLPFTSWDNPFRIEVPVSTSKARARLSTPSNAFG